MNTIRGRNAEVVIKFRLRDLQNTSWSHQNFDYHVQWWVTNCRKRYFVNIRTFIETRTMPIYLGTRENIIVKGKRSNANLGDPENSDFPDRPLGLRGRTDKTTRRVGIIPHLAHSRQHDRQRKRSALVGVSRCWRYCN